MKASFAVNAEDAMQKSAPALPRFRAGRALLFALTQVFEMDHAADFIRI